MGEFAGRNAGLGFAGHHHEAFDLGGEQGFGMGVPRLSKSCHILLGSPSMIGSVGVAIRLSGTRCRMELGNDVTRIAVVWLVDTAVRGLAVCQTARYWQGLWQSWSLYLS